MSNLRFYKRSEPPSFNWDLFIFMSYLLWGATFALCVVCFMYAVEKDNIDWLIAGIIFLIFLIAGLVAFGAKYRRDKLKT